MTETAETKRDRVRRLLIDPLADIGFRFPKGVKAEKAQKDLDRIADGLAYLSDENLKRLRHSLKTKGEGSAKCFWPCYATITGLAEVAQARPLKHESNLLSWFASRAGAEALDAGRLVAEFQFFERHKRPPVNESDKRTIAREAAECGDRVMRIEDKLNRKVTLAADDQGFIDWYRAKLTYCTNLVNGGVECS
ncbi:hypothetical protein [Halocynthiibacter namhaensis]|uniref:hypothetical protein n=1 Tax=Halocynthiibacter namhaensis TaxID=1290553 RepID=UPI00068BD0E3|nr:hypothetical protein [Halocynthiibacter namhaensis]